MIFGGPRVPGLLVLLAVLTACADDPEPEPVETVSRVAALAGYDPPPGAPGFCALLAGSTHLPAVPAALGALTVDPTDDAARRDLTAAVDDLRLVLDDVRFSVEHADLETAVEDLVAALTDAADAPVTADTGESVAAALDAVGTQAQPWCEFPT